MRLAVILCVVAITTSACGSSDRPAAEDTPKLGAMSMHPILETGSSQCSGDLTKRSSDGTTCYSLSEGFTTTNYRAERSDAAGARGVAVDVTLEAKDLERFNGLARKCFDKDVSCPTQQIAIVYDDKVLSAPTVQAPTFAGSISITAGDEDVLRVLLDDLPE